MVTLTSRGWTDGLHTDDNSTRKMSEPFSQFAVYTIRRSSDLATIFAAGGAGEFTERRKWTSALALFEDAKRTATQLPVIFAGGDFIDGLLYWAIVKDLSASDASTTYRFSGMRRLDSKPPLSSLRLRSTDARLSDDFIRPYAIVHTPHYIRQQSGSYLTYWKPRNIDWDDPSHTVLDHTAGNQLKKVCPRDRLYLMTYRGGEFYLLGRIVAEAVVSQAQAARRLGRKAKELWEADYHVLAAPPVMRAVAIPFRQTLEQLHLASGRPVGRLQGPNSVQGFRVLREISSDSAAVLDALLGDPPATSAGLPDVDIHAHEAASNEGKLALRLHLARERDPRLVAWKKRAAGSLACEACGFSFRDRYGADAADYCEVHHLLPLAQRDVEQATRLDDLAILCANCHRVSHLRMPPFTIAEIRAMLTQSAERLAGVNSEKRQPDRLPVPSKTLRS